MNATTKAANTNVPPLLIFDLVATLTDAGPRYAEAYIRMCRAWNVEAPATEEILSALGNKNLKQIIAEFTPSLPADRVGEFMNDCNNACDTLLYNVQWHEDLYPHVRDTLKQLQAGGYALGIYTGTREGTLESQLRYHNIKSYFDARFLRGKNNERDGFMDSDMLKAAQLESIIQSYAETYGIDANAARVQTIVVGDSVADLKAARKAGMSFIGFATGEMAHNKFTAMDPSLSVFGDFRELPALLVPPVQTSRPKPAGFRL